MKKICYMCLVFGILCTLCACNNIKIESNDMDKWLKNAELSKKETPRELYEKALKEDTLVIYSESTRVMDVKKSFEEKYTGLTVLVYDMRSTDLAAKLMSNNESRNYNCDIVLCSDNNGEISKKFLPKGIVAKYVPYDMKDKFYPDCNQDILTLMGEVEQVFYNPEVNKEVPIYNWWELTEEKYRGRVIFSNPLKSVTQMGLFCMMIKEEKQMRDAYYELYGKELELDVDENAGKVFIRMLMDNDAVVVNSSDEIIEKVGATDQTDPFLGIMVSSKIRMKEYGYDIAPIEELTPFVGTYSPNSIMIAGGSKNINAAKLFIRWIYGEVSGQGEGYKPYLTEGTWSARKDVKSASKLELEDMKLINLDTDYIYNTQKEFKDFWISLIKEN